MISDTEMNMKTMKHRIISMVAGVLLAGLLPIVAQTLPLQSTSTMKGAGSEYSAKVSLAGTEKVTFIPMKSTSTMMETGYVPTPNSDNPDLGTTRGPRRGKENPGDPGETGDESSPIGEPWILLLFAAAGTGVIAWRRRANEMITDCKQLEEK